MNKSNYYDVLSIGVDADNEQIKKAYREAAKKYHPDMNRNSGSDELFKIVYEAYDTLIDEAKRREYDRTLPASLFRKRKRKMASKVEEEVFEENKPTEKNHPILNAIRLFSVIVFFIAAPVGSYFMIHQNLNYLIFYYAWILLLYVFTKWIWGLSVVGVAVWCAYCLLEGNNNQAMWGIYVFLAIALIVWVIKPSVYEFR